MLSLREFAYLGAVKRRDSVEAFLEEQSLRSRASKSQQLRMYGYWQRGKVDKKAIATIPCPLLHDNEDCLACGRDWGYHENHDCPNGITMGTFPGCRS